MESLTIPAFANKSLKLLSLDYNNLWINKHLRMFMMERDDLFVTKRNNNFLESFIHKNISNTWHFNGMKAVTNWGKFHFYWIMIHETYFIEIKKKNCFIFLMMC